MIFQKVYGWVCIGLGAIAIFASIENGMASLVGGSNCLQKPYNIHRNRLKTLAFYY